jgi:hypothetical protein
MTNHIASIDDFKDYRKTIVLASSIRPLKTIEFVLIAEIGPNNTIELYNQIHVLNMFDKIVYTGNHFSLAINAYNSLEY